MSRETEPAAYILPRNPPQPALRLHRELEAVWSRPRGWRGWLVSVNHSEIGLRFMGAAFFFFAVAGLLSMLIRAQLATQGGDFLDVAHYNQIFTMHGSMMMFLFAIPMLEGLAMYLLPRMLGSRDLAFPRLSALGWWCYLFGGTIILAAQIAGVAPDGGWFMYAPLSSREYSPGINADIWLLGITFVEISAISAAVEITVTILRLRAPGMKLTEMPLFAWYMLGTAAMMLVGFPPLILGSILLELERAFDWPFFDVARGGDPLLWQHLFWLFGHPEVYIIFLPAAGAISTILPVLSRTRIVGYGAIVAAILGLVFLSFGLWVHHMFTVGIPHMALAFFSAASALVAVPTAVQIFAWIGTLWKGRPEMKLPMLHLMGFFGTFVMGGLTGVMLAIVPFNWQVHDTAFVTAHLHYVLIGGFVFPMLAAITYWMPLISGRAGLKGPGVAAFWLILIGFHGTFFLMHLTGLLGMPRRIASYAHNPEWEWLNLISSFFGFVMAAGFALFALDLVMQALFGKASRRNPWGAKTFEWRLPRFGPSYNFASLPPAAGLSALELAKGEGALPGAPRGRREVLVVEAVSGRPVHVAVLPGNGLLPFWTGLAICGFVLLMLAGLYPLAGLALAGVASVCWLWGRGSGAEEDEPALPVAPGLALAPHWQVEDPLSRSGMICLLIADSALFGSFLFGIGFLSVVAPGWPAPPGGLGLWQFGLAGAATLLSLIAAHAARQREGRGAGVGALANVLALLLLALLAFGLDDPTAHARPALIAAGLGLVALHLLVAAMLALRCDLQRRSGRISARRPAAQPCWRLWQDFTAAITLALLALVLLQELTG